MEDKYNVSAVLNENKELTEEEQKAAQMAAAIRFLMMKLQGELPPEEYPRIVRKLFRIPVSNNETLAAVVYMPAEEGSWPVILQRTPYGPVEFLDSDAAAEMFAKRGYAYCIVRCRGTGISDGYFSAFEQETVDGLEVIDYISAIDWCNGSIGTYGGSYMGHSQWAIAGCNNPALKTMYIQVFGGHPYANFYRNGMLLQDIWQSWITANGGNARGRTEEESNRLHQEAFSLKPPVQIAELVNDPLAWGIKILKNPQECDPCWQQGFWKKYEDNARKLSVPILMQCGWFDLFCQSQLDTWRTLSPEIRTKSLCLIGPWDHYGFANHVLPYPGNDQYGVMQLKTALSWFDHHLKGKPLGLPIGGMQTYCIGEDTWKFWPDVMQSDNHCVLYLDAERLTDAAGPNGSISYAYNSEHPARSLALGLNKGTVVMPKPGQRENVFSFISDPLEKDICLAGSMTAELYVSSSAPATAFTVALVDERTDGNGYLVFNDITDIRYENDRFQEYMPGTVKKLVLHCMETLWTFKKGSRIRIDISSSDFPWYNAHNNTTTPWGLATESQEARNMLYFGVNTPSKIILPIME